MPGQELEGRFHLLLITNEVLLRGPSDRPAQSCPSSRHCDITPSCLTEPVLGHGLCSSHLPPADTKLPGRGRARTGVGHSRTPHLNQSRARDGLSRCLLSEWRHSHMLYLLQQVNDRGRVLPGSSRLQSTQSFTRVPHSVTTQKPPRRKDPREEQGREVRPGLEASCCPGSLKDSSVAGHPSHLRSVSSGFLLLGSLCASPGPCSLPAFLTSCKEADVHFDGRTECSPAPGKFWRN